MSAKRSSASVCELVMSTPCKRFDGSVMTLDEETRFVITFFQNEDYTTFAVATLFGSDGELLQVTDRESVAGMIAAAVTSSAASFKEYAVQRGFYNGSAADRVLDRLYEDPRTRGMIEDAYRAEFGG